MINKCVIMGRLTRDPELKTTQSGLSVVRFTLAVDRRFKNQSGERESDFVSCVAWRQTADFIAKYFNKGSKLAIVGSIQTGSYERDGQTVYTTDVVADEAYFVESQGQSRASAESQRSSGGAQPQTFSDPFTRTDDSSLPFDL